MRTKAIRYRRIVKHTFMYLITFNKIHWYEVEHYYYMKRFSDIKD